MKKRKVVTKYNEQFTSEDMKRYMGALSEDFQGRVYAIGEQFGGLNGKLDKLHNSVGHIERNIAVMKGDIEFIKIGLKRKVDYDEFSSLAKRVAALERRV